MKIRTGFVSNSSSSSFCMYGTMVELEELEQALIAKGFLTPEVTEEDIEADEYGREDVEDYESTRRVTIMAEQASEAKSSWYTSKPEKEARLKKNYFHIYNLDLEQIDDYTEVYVGMKYPHMPDDKTLGEIKAEIKKKLEDLLGREVKCETHEEAWYPC